MTTESVLSPTGSSNRSPRALWVGGGLVALVGAALAGALVMRSVDSPAPPAPQPLTAAAPSGTPQAALGGTAWQPVPGANDNAMPPPPAVGKAVVPAGTPVPATETAAAPQPVPAAPTLAPAPAPAPAAAPTVARAPAVCKSCGVVESVVTVREKGQGTGIGAVSGGLVGGLAGHQIGGGHGNTAMTVLGAVGGVLAGNEVEKRVRATTHYDVHVRMADGSTRVFRRDQPMADGARVVVNGSTMRLAR